jgi:hypothetical protein
MDPLPTTEPEIDAFLEAFESGTLPKTRWTHAAHLFTGACYVHQLGEAAAIDHLRHAIPRYNEAAGGVNTETTGYHETITVFWLKVLAQLFATQPTETTRAAFATLAVERFANDRDILRRHYDFDILASTQARRTWIAPNIPPSLGTREDP